LLKCMFEKLDLRQNLIVAAESVDMRISGRSFKHRSSSSRVRFNDPTNTLYVISGTGFTGQMTQPSVSKYCRKIES